MGLLQENDKKAVKKEFEKITKTVKIIMVKSEDKNECQLCEETKSLLEEVSDLNDKIVLEVHDKSEADVIMAKYGFDKFPAFVVTDEEGTNNGVRFFGIPAGYEFISLMGAIIEVGSGEIELTAKSKELVKSIDKPLHLQVFVTPSCPYCPRAVRTAHQMAMLNENITADMVEAQEFFDLSNKYNVMGVPRVVVNEDSYFEGALPEAIYIERVIKAVNGEMSGNLAADLR